MIPVQRAVIERRRRVQLHLYDNATDHLFKSKSKTKTERKPVAKMKAPSKCQCGSCLPCIRRLHGRPANRVTRRRKVGVYTLADL